MQGGNCYITDLGLCGPVDEKSSNKVYGIVSYVAPEVLRGKKNTKESDVYSVGMLMWEIFAGHPPFDDRAHNHRLIFDIWGMDNRKGHNYQNRDFELTTLLCVICYKD